MVGKQLKSLRRVLFRQGIISVTLPIFVLGILSLSVSGVMLFNSISERNRTIVEQGALQVDQHIKDLDSDIRLLAQELPNTPNPHEFMRRFLIAHPSYSTVWIADSSGRIIQAEPSSGNLVGMDRSGSEAYQISRTSGNESHFSSTYISYELQEPVVTISLPYQGGVIALEYKTRSLNRYMAEVSRKQSFYLVLTDNTGTWITHPDSSKLLQREIDPNSPYLREVEAGGNKDSQLIRFEKQLSTFFVRKNSSAGWYIVIYQPISAVVNPLMLQACLMGIIGIFLIIYSFVQNTRIVNRTIVPIEHFVGAAAAISRGRYTLSLPTVSFEEFHTLTEAFQSMVLSIQQREQEQNSLWKQLIQSQKMEVMGSLAGGIAHDFNNILTAIGGFAELLTNKGVTDSVRVEYATEIINTTDRAAALTRQLLTFSRKEDVKISDIEAVGCINSLIAMLKRIVGEDIQLSFTKHTETSYIRVDKNHLEQILLNFTVNAADALRENRCSDPKIQISIASENKKVKISVSDNGPGIPKDIIAHIFEPFFTTKPAGKGTGMGLATVKGIVEQHGAELQVDTGESGTAFTTVWDEHPAPEAKAIEPSEKSTVGHRRILFTDDEPMLRKVGAAMLKQLGHDVTEAKDGLDALEHLEKDPTFDLLMTDLIMPGGLSGDQLASEALQIKPDLKIMFLSGYTDSHLNSPELENQDIHFLSKPFTVDALREALHRRFTE